MKNKIIQIKLIVNVCSFCHGALQLDVSTLFADIGT